MRFGLTFYSLKVCWRYRTSGVLGEGEPTFLYNQHSLGKRNGLARDDLMHNMQSAL